MKKMGQLWMKKGQFVEENRTAPDEKGQSDEENRTAPYI